MNHTKANPRPSADGAGAGNAQAGKRCNPCLDLPKIKAKSWITAGGTEFMAMPDTAGVNEDGDIIYLFPPGEGWFATIADRVDGHTLWQRRRRRS